MVNRIKGFRESVLNFHPVVWAVLVGTVFVRAASSMSLPFLAIYLSRNTDLSPVWIGLAIGVGPLAGTVGSFVGGTLSDRFGRKVIIITSLLVWTGVFLGYGFAKGFAAFTLLGILGGFCRSFFEPVSQALMADLTPAEQRLQVFGLRYTAINIGVAIGPVAGASLAAISGRIPFFVTASAYFVYALILWVMMIAYRVAGSSESRRERITLKASLGVVKNDIALRWFIGGGIFVGFGYSQMTATLSQFVESTFVDGVQLFSILMSVNALTVVLMQLPLTRFSEGKSPLHVIIFGNVLYAIGDLGFAFSNQWTAFILSMIIFTLGEILIFPSSSLFIDRIAPEGMRGTYFGANGFSSLGGSIGPIAGGWLLLHYGGSVLFVCIAVITLFSTTFYFGGQRHQRKKAMTIIFTEKT